MIFPFQLHSLPHRLALQVLFETKKSQISVWDIKTLAKQIVSNGLTVWVPNKAK